MYEEINVNRVLYKTLTTTKFNSKNMRFLFKSRGDKMGQPNPFWPDLPLACQKRDGVG